MHSRQSKSDRQVGHDSPPRDASSDTVCVDQAAFMNRPSTDENRVSIVSSGPSTQSVFGLGNPEISRRTSDTMACKQELGAVCKVEGYSFNAARMGGEKGVGTARAKKAALICGIGRRNVEVFC